MPSMSAEDLLRICSTCQKDLAEIRCNMTALDSRMAGLDQSIGCLMKAFAEGMTSSASEKDTRPEEGGAAERTFRECSQAKPVTAGGDAGAGEARSSRRDDGALLVRPVPAGPLVPNMPASTPDDHAQVPLVPGSDAAAAEDEAAEELEEVYQNQGEQAKSLSILEQQVAFIECFKEEMLADRTLLLSQLNNLFKMRSGEELPYKASGYEKLRDFLSDIPGIALVGRGNRMQVRVTDAAAMEAFQESVLRLLSDTSESAAASLPQFRRPRPLPQPLLQKIEELFLCSENHEIQLRSFLNVWNAHFPDEQLGYRALGFRDVRGLLAQVPFIEKEGGKADAKYILRAKSSPASRSEHSGGQGEGPESPVLLELFRELSTSVASVAGDPGAAANDASPSAQPQCFAPAPLQIPLQSCVPVVGAQNPFIVPMHVPPGLPSFMPVVLPGGLNLEVSQLGCPVPQGGCGTPSRPPTGDVAALGTCMTGTCWAAGGLMPTPPYQGLFAERHRPAEDDEDDYDEAKASAALPKPGVSPGYRKPRKAVSSFKSSPGALCSAAESLKRDRMGTTMQSQDCDNMAKVLQTKLRPDKPGIVSDINAGQVVIVNTHAERLFECGTHGSRLADYDLLSLFALEDQDKLCMSLTYLMVSEWPRMEQQSIRIQTLTGRKKAVKMQGVQIIGSWWQLDFEEDGSSQKFVMQ